MSIEKISSGLTNQTSEAPPARLNAHFTSIPDLIESAHAADHKAKELTNKIEASKATLSTRREEIEVRWSGVADLPPERRRALAAKEARKVRNEIAKASEESRWEDLRTLNAAADKAQAAAIHYESPAAMLAREGLGSEERQRFQFQLAHSGPAELRNFARVAVATKNRVLGAAVMARLDSMKPVERRRVGFGRQALSHALVGEEFEHAQQAIQVIRNRAQSALNLNRAFESGRGSGNTIKAALDARGEGDLLEEALEPHGAAGRDG